MLNESATTNNYVASGLSSKLSIVDDAISKIPINSKAPDFFIPDTAGSAIKLTDFKGKYLLIDFGASWCGPAAIIIHI